MKFTLIGPVYPFRGGISHFTTELTRTLRQKHDVQVISFKRQYPQWLYPGQSDHDPSQSTRQVNAMYLLDSLNPLTWHKTTQATIAHNPNIVIMQWWTTFFAPMNIVIGRILRRAGVRLLYVVHNTLPHEAHPWDVPLARYTLGSANQLLALSHREQHRLKTLFPNKAVFYAPLPTYTMFKNDGLSQEDARKRLGLPPTAQIVLFFGIVRPYKGLKILLESLTYLCKESSKIHGLIVGEFWEDISYYQHYAKEYHLEKHVTLHPQYIPDEMVATYFIAADAFAAPYTSTTQSAAIKTALGFGLPIAASEAAIENTDIPQGYPLFSAPVNDPEKLAVALNQALHSARATDISSSSTWEKLVRVIETQTATG